MNLNCKVICTDDGGDHTFGKVYSVIDGKLNSDVGMYPSDDPMETGFMDLWI